MRLGQGLQEPRLRVGATSRSRNSEFTPVWHVFTRALQRPQRGVSAWSQDLQKRVSIRCPIFRRIFPVSLYGSRTPLWRHPTRLYPTVHPVL
jgi:hypothetical protein